MKHIFFVFALTLSVQGHAAEKIVCQSSQTSYTYIFDIANSTVDITSADDSFSANAEVTYTPMQGDDILYTISQGDYQVGVINGEEGLRAHFDHGIFESNTLDKDLVCKSVSNESEVMWDEQGNNCSVNASVFDSIVGEQEYVSLNIYTDISNGHYLVDPDVYQALFVEKKDAQFETKWNAVKYVGKNTDDGYIVEINSTFLMNRIYKNYFEENYVLYFDKDGNIDSIEIKTHEKWPFPSNILFNKKRNLNCHF